jgi:hypothetical protein
VDALGNYIGGEQQISDTATNALTQPIENVDGVTPGGSNKYKAETMMYPADLFDPEKGNVNHVRFYINIQSDSKAEADNMAMGGVAGIAPNRESMNSIMGKPFSSGTFAGVKAVEGALGGTGLGAIFSGNISGALKGAAGGAALGGGAAIATTTVLEDFAGVKFGQPSKRLAGFIALYMPNQLATRYSMQWQEEEMDLAVTIATNPEVAKSLEAVKDSLSKGNIKDAASAGGGIAGKIVGAELLKKSPSLSAASRSAANPRKEQLFKGVDYRRFTFDYQFAPRDSDEARDVLQIVNMFKYHMHPEFKDSSNFIYIYPSEFDIEYCFGNGPNQRLHKISSCVLTEMNINYSPNGVFSTFPDGMPTQINIQMSFTELELLTKERIKAGL